MMDREPPGLITNLLGAFFAALTGVLFAIILLLALVNQASAPLGGA